MRRLLDHARRNAIAYLALFVALGGSSYAAISIPNGSITSAKLNKHSIGGYVLAWAHVRADGKLIAGSPGAVPTYLSELAGETPPGDNYIVAWRGLKVPGRCATTVTIDDAGPLTSRGATAEAHIFPKRAFAGQAGKTNGQVMVDIANASDDNVPDNFYVEVVC
jgi:hypothetical protein